MKCAITSGLLCQTVTPQLLLPYTVLQAMHCSNNVTCTNDMNIHQPSMFFWVQPQGEEILGSVHRVHTLKGRSFPIVRRHTNHPHHTQCIHVLQIIFSAFLKKSHQLRSVGKAKWLLCLRGNLVGKRGWQQQTQCLMVDDNDGDGSGCDGDDNDDYVWDQRHVWEAGSGTLGVWLICCPRHMSEDDAGFSQTPTSSSLLASTPLPLSSLSSSSSSSSWLTGKRPPSTFPSHQVELCHHEVPDRRDIFVFPPHCSGVYLLINHVTISAI